MTHETDKTRPISDDEMRNDIADTEAEIRAAQRTIELVQKGIREREEFVAKLIAILNEREVARRELSSEVNENG
jgi:hypothetical protein